MEHIESPKTVTSKFNAMPRITQVAIIAGSLGGAALIIGAIAFICIRQRRKGGQAARLAELQQQQEAGLLAYKA